MDIDTKVIENMMKAFESESYEDHNPKECLSCQMYEKFILIEHARIYASNIALDFNSDPRAVMFGLSMGFELGKRYAESIELERLNK